MVVEERTKKPAWVHIQPYLYRNTGSGRYYSRLGRQGFRTLKTDRLTVARARLTARLQSYQSQQGLKNHAMSGDVTMAEVISLFTTASKESTDLEPATKKHREVCLLRLSSTWPDLGALKPRQVTASEIDRWASRALRSAAKVPPGAKRLPKAYSRASLKKTASILRLVLEQAKKLGAIADVPVFTVFRDKRRRHHQLPAYALPRRADLKPLLDELQFPRNCKIRDAVMAIGGPVEGKSQAELAKDLKISVSTFKRYKSGKGSIGNGKEAADFARLLIFTGARVAEARNLTWGNVDFEKGQVTIRGTKSETSVRNVPMLPECREFLLSLPRGRPEDKISQVGDINGSLAGACHRLGIKKVTHHSLRHLFATICIESGVDIPTVSRWLGHADGGALAMRVYGHLRDEHSQTAAAKVKVF